MEGQISAFNSSLEKAREEAVAVFKKSDEYKNRLDGHYPTGYEDFCADAKEAFPDLDFDSLKIPLATESSLLPTSFKDVNVVDDATNEVTQDTTVASKDVPKSGGDTYLSKFIFLLEKFYHFSFLGMPIILGFTFLEFIQVQFLRPSLWTRYTYSCLYWLFITKGFLDGGHLPFLSFYE